ncbi:beta-alanine transporter-like [Macrobrachium rosenbergii]|uniref:beta-alanine transporter-like n=1 Tax=Macrobrachium rosenbergii TaxID=79674 RepID=UPI0034D5BC80
MPIITNGRPVNLCIDNAETGDSAIAREMDIELTENVARSGRTGKKSRNRPQDDGVNTEDCNEATNIDMVMRWADSLGAYECVLIWAWVVPVCLLAPCAFMNILLMTYLPPHHCTPPPVPPNITMAAWLNITIPRSDNGNFESCSMYDYVNISNTSSSLGATGDDSDLGGRYQMAALSWRTHHPDDHPPNVTTGCQFGYEFSKNYFTETAATEMGWVCDKFYLIEHVLHSAILGNLAGCVIFGALADKIGRRKVFLLLSLKVAILGSVFVFLRDMWFVLRVRFVLSMGLPVIYQIVIISALEQVRDSRRGMVTSISSVFFSLGQCTMALLSWLTAHWVTLGLLTSLPCLLAVVYLRVIEESPRWLVSRGKLNEAAKVIRRIARMNDLRPTHEDILAKLRKDTTNDEEEAKDEPSCHFCGVARYPHLAFRRAFLSVLSTFCSVVKFVGHYPSISCRTALLTVCWTVNQTIYFSIFMKYSLVFKNPFLGFFFTSVVEVPANLLVPLLLKRVGRRSLHTSVMSICATALLITAVLLGQDYEENVLGVQALVLLAKFCTSITFLVTYLQAAELHPTPIRTCATGVASLIASSFNVATPSIVLAMEKPWHSYLVLGSLGCIGALSSLLLPETAGRLLPQTLDEAESLERKFCVSLSDSRRPDIPSTRATANSANEINSE